MARKTVKRRTGAVSKKRAQDDKGPDYIAYHVPPRENAFWIRIGAAWEHKDGNGLTADLELLPVGVRRIVFRRAKPDGNES